MLQPRLTTGRRRHRRKHLLAGWIPIPAAMTTTTTLRGGTPSGLLRHPEPGGTAAPSAVTTAPPCPTPTPPRASARGVDPYPGCDDDDNDAAGWDPLCRPSVSLRTRGHCHSLSGHDGPTVPPCRHHHEHLLAGWILIPAALMTTTQSRRRHQLLRSKEPAITGLPRCRSCWMTGDASASIYSQGGSLQDNTPCLRAAACRVGPLLHHPEQGALLLPQWLRQAHNNIAMSICLWDGSLSQPQ